jgi:chromosome partitioning protein
MYTEAEELIQGTFGLTVAPVRLHERAAFHHSTAGGQDALEWEPDGKAAAEARALWAWTREQLHMSTSERVHASPVS